MKMKSKYYGYKDTDLLMDPFTGSIDTASNWAYEFSEEDFKSLIQAQICTIFGRKLEGEENFIVINCAGKVF